METHVDRKPRQSKKRDTIVRQFDPNVDLFNEDVVLSDYSELFDLYELQFCTLQVSEIEDRIQLTRQRLKQLDELLGNIVGLSASPSKKRDTKNQLAFIEFDVVDSEEFA